MIYICSKIISLYWKVKKYIEKSFFTQKFYFDQPQDIEGLFMYTEEVIKSAKSFNNKFNEQVVYME